MEESTRALAQSCVIYKSLSGSGTDYFFPLIKIRKIKFDNEPSSLSSYEMGCMLPSEAARFFSPFNEIEFATNAPFPFEEGLQLENVDSNPAVHIMSRDYIREAGKHVAVYFRGDALQWYAPADAERATFQELRKTVITLREDRVVDKVDDLLRLVDEPVAPSKITTKITLAKVDSTGHLICGKKAKAMVKFSVEVDTPELGRSCQVRRLQPAVAKRSLGHPHKITFEKDVGDELMQFLSARKYVLFWYLTVVHQSEGGVERRFTFRVALRCTHKANVATIAEMFRASSSQMNIECEDDITRNEFVACATYLATCYTCMHRVTKGKLSPDPMAYEKAHFAEPEMEKLREGAVKSVALCATAPPKNELERGVQVPERVRTFLAAAGLKCKAAYIEHELGEQKLDTRLFCPEPLLEFIRTPLGPTQAAADKNGNAEADEEFDREYKKQKSSK